MNTQREPFGNLPDGQAVERFTLTNDHGLSATLCSFGALLTALHAPDRNGNLADVTLGFDTLEQWRANPGYMGATVGRYGNRIAQARFPLDQQVYHLTANEGPNHLHGGAEGFHQKLWQADPFDGARHAGVKFRYTSPDGEEGYPGTLAAEATYTLNDANELSIVYEATTDAPTVVNLVHHTYWNLTGDSGRDILGHQLKIPAEHYLPVDDASIPIGELAPVVHTAMDFREAHRIGDRLHDAPNKGYDHNFVLKPHNSPDMIPAAEVHDPDTGRVLELFTDQPGVQFYAGLFLGAVTGKGGVTYPRYSGLCLETQKWPDTPNQPRFPTAVLRPGEQYRHVMLLRFGTR